MTDLTSLVLYPFFNPEGLLQMVQFECPGCGYGHPLHVLSVPGYADWAWNGSLVKPTLSPSVLVHLPEGGVCHSFVRGGKIEFLSDSAHALAGQTVPLVGYPMNEFDGCPKTIAELREGWS